MPLRARPAARLTAVVVLPTPPFWLAMVKTVVGISGAFSFFGCRGVNSRRKGFDLDRGAAMAGIGAWPRIPPSRRNR